jgi:predicted nucleic acid-binding protein
MSPRILVLDANILIRAVLGSKVRELLLKFNNSVEFFTPDVCMEDAQKYLPTIFEKRQLPVESALDVLYRIKHLIKIVEKSIYLEQENDAKQRVKSRDIHDWPVVATALVLNSPIWSEDQDFFGVGLPIWTTDRIQIFFESV